MLSTSRTHLAEARESYGQHLRFAFLVGLMLAGAGIACILHALIPGCCRRTASRTVQCMIELFRDRTRLPGVVSELSGSLVLVGLLTLSLPALGLLLVMAQHTAIALPLALVLAAVPATYLWSNADLNPVV